MRSIGILSCLAVLLGLVLLSHGQTSCWNLGGIHPVTTQKFDLGESPYWNARKQKLYFVDITGASYHSYNPLTGTVASVKTECPTVAFIIPVKGTSDKYIIGCGNKLNLISWDGNDQTGSMIRTLTTVGGDNERLNVANVDSNGRLITGTLTDASDADKGNKEGSLYRIGSDLTPVKILEGVSIPTGIDFNNGHTRMFFNDLTTGVVKQYVYHKENGTISNENVLFDLKANNFTGYPGGMAIDILGDLWVTDFNANRIIHIRGSTGELLCHLDMPVAGVTGLAFGGLLLDILYATTVSNSTIIAEEATNENDGALFSIRGLLHIGRLSYQFKLD